MHKFHNPNPPAGANLPALDRGDTVLVLADIRYGTRVMVEAGEQGKVHRVFPLTAQVIPEGKKRPVEISREQLRKLE